VDSQHSLTENAQDPQGPACSELSPLAVELGLTREAQQYLELLARRRAERLAREQQQLVDRANDLKPPPVPSNDEVIRLARRDPVAALALLDDFGRAWSKTVDRLVDDKARELLDTGEYGDPDDFYRVIGELPDGRIEGETVIPDEADDDARDWLRELRPDLYGEYRRMHNLAEKVARITHAPARVRAVAERSWFLRSDLRFGLRRRRLDRRGAVPRVAARSRGVTRPRERRERRAKSSASSSRGAPSDSDGDSDPPAVGGALVDAGDRLAFLSLLGDGEHPQEVRWFTPNGARKAFAVDPRDADEIAERAIRAGHETFGGVLPRLGSDGERQRQYAPSSVLWADCDTERSVAKSAMFDPPPTCVLLSGGFDGFTPRQHVYWLLDERVPADEIARHVRRLAAFLEADLASTDPARVLRLPGSVNRKTGIAARVERLSDDRYSLAEIVGELPDAPAQSAGRGVQAPLTERVSYGARHDYLKGAAVRLLRGGFTDERLIARLLATVFEVECEPLPPPRPGEFADFARWAVRTEIAERERNRAERERELAEQAAALPERWWVRS